MELVVESRIRIFILQTMERHSSLFSRATDSIHDAYSSVSYTNFWSNSTKCCLPVPNFNIREPAADWGCKTDTTSTVNKIKSKNTEVSVGLADNSYGTTADCWFSKIAPIDGQMHTAIGNHDVTSTQLLRSIYESL